ncbi:9921_t:CDS:2 [Dentiscutata heterogama]|uniref:9921_t:CDS:1 n=1 Tax=Dentiscutata heterogama TaxID=1316150 RepID=A0ACA9KB94_9GLOM|nr:9921_t:CDS:2 [Dentiscutata heterogama]
MKFRFLTQHFIIGSNDIEDTNPISFVTGWIIYEKFNDPNKSDENYEIVLKCFQSKDYLSTCHLYCREEIKQIMLERVGFRAASAAASCKLSKM